MKSSANDHLKLKLENLNTKTEEIYLNLGRSFPELFRELELGFKESSKLVSYFTTDIAPDEKQESHLLVADIIAKAKEVIAEASHFFIAMGERDRGLFESINRGIDNLTSLDERIENIREDSLDMELISLNAMTTALKAGGAGRGFSYITDELNKLSSRTVAYTRELTSQGGNTLGIFYSFRKKLDGIKNFQEAFYKDFQRKLNSSFESCNQGLKRLTEILLGVIDEAKCIKKPLYRIMEEVQLQDIIKQSVMHVIISLKEIEIGFASDSQERFMDEISFVEKIPELCINLLDDVKERITKSLTVFRENLSYLRQIMRSVEEEKAVFLDFVTVKDSDKTDGGSLDQMFSESVRVLEELLEGINRSMEEKQRIGQDGTLITEGLKMLEESFQKFFEIVNRFYCIKVFSRIEIATQGILKGQNRTIQEMTRLTGRIDEDMKEALGIIDKAMTRTNRTIGQYSKEFVDEILVVKQMADRIKESYERLIFSKTSLSEVLKSFSVYTDRFLSLLDDSESDMKRLGELIEVINGIEEGLRSIQTDAQEKKKEALKKMGLEEWKIINDKMKEMIDRFTIFTHKKTAALIGGFEVEKGSEEGELTLF